MIVPQPGLADDALKRKARGWAVLTRNSRDFVEDAVRYDYDVIGLEDVKFVDDRGDRTNDTVRKISAAVRRSQLGTRKGDRVVLLEAVGVRREHAGSKAGMAS